jgi:hypothetical protein
MKKLWTRFNPTMLDGPAMQTPSGTSPGGDFVNFNGVPVPKSSVPTLVQLLVECDPMTTPSGEGLEETRRDGIARLFQGHIDLESSPSFLSSLGNDLDSLRYLTGLMASRF